MVRRATHKKTKQAVAVKILRLPPSMRALVAGTAPPAPRASEGEAADEEALDEEDILKEVAILRDLDSPFCIRLIAYYLGPAEAGVIYLVQELLPGGPLLEALLAHEGAYSEREARLGFEALLRGLHYLHLRGITHRDVKLDNLLLAKDADLSSAKLVDFGLAASSFEASPADENGMRWMCGSAAYMAPEVATRKVPYTCAVDMWSAGVVLHLLLTGLTPFPAGKDDEDTLRAAKEKRFAVRLDGPEWQNVSMAAKDLVTKLLTVKPESRINAARALMHPWVSPPPSRPGSFRCVDGNLAHTMSQLRTYATVRLALVARCVAPASHCCNRLLIAGGEAARVGVPAGHAAEHENRSCRDHLPDQARHRGGACAAFSRRVGACGSCRCRRRGSGSRRLRFCKTEPTARSQRRWQHSLPPGHHTRLGRARGRHRCCDRPRGAVVTHLRAIGRAQWDDAVAEHGKPERRRVGQAG